MLIWTKPKIFWGFLSAITIRELAGKEKTFTQKTNPRFMWNIYLEEKNIYFWVYNYNIWIHRPRNHCVLMETRFRLMQVPTVRSYQWVWEVTSWSTKNSKPHSLEVRKWLQCGTWMVLVRQECSSSSCFEVDSE